MMDSSAPNGTRRRTFLVTARDQTAIGATVEGRTLLELLVAIQRERDDYEQALLDLMEAVGEEPYQTGQLMKAMEQAKEILRR